MFTPVEKSNEIDKTLSKTLEKLVELLENITEFNSKELMSISLLQTNKYMKELMKYYVKNKKHVKRRHAKEIAQALKYIAEPMSMKSVLEALKGLRGV